MEGFWFRVKMVLSPAGGYLVGRLFILFLEKVVHLPFYEWQEETIGVICAVLAFYLFCKWVDKKYK